MSDHSAAHRRLISPVAVWPRAGYSSGRHYWELEVLSMRDDYAWAGVAEAGVDTSTYLASTGYAVSGHSGGGSWYPYAKGTPLRGQPKVPHFKCGGDRVGFLLDLGAETEARTEAEGDARAKRTLEYFLNGESQGVTHSGKHSEGALQLPSSGALFPAVSGGYESSAQFRARFDLRCPH